ncbi:cytochrome P450 [Streptomyces fuscichromogenes]|uniref:cytochrome P450 n=1 Tax=Streptomyces fuscichromogenes TaxID=1324013 RepID=UPI0037FA3BD5
MIYQALDTTSSDGPVPRTGRGHCPGTNGARAPLGTLDLFGEEFVRDPHPWLDRLRSESPVHYDPATRLWLVSRYDDVRRVLLDPMVFHPDNALHAVTPLPVSALRILARAGFSLPAALANNGSASHPGLRRVVTRFFNAERVAAAVPVITRITEDLLDAAVSEIDATGRCDLFGAFAQVLPCRVLMELLGIGGVDPATLIRWSDASLELFWGRPGPDRQAELAENVGEFYQWLTSKVCGGGALSGSFVGELARHRLPSGKLLDVATAVAACFFVFIAGQSTTGQLIATVLRSALADTGLWEQMPREEGLAEAWVEEVLRREPPVTTWRRVAACPTELGGVCLPEGAQLLLMLMGTGSDTNVFPDPDRMRPPQPNIRHHLAFGVGRHRCPGASLVRTEAAVALRSAADRLSGVRLETGTALQPPMLGLLSFRAPLNVTVIR